MVAARYWRLKVVNVLPYTSQYIRLSEVEFADEVGGADLTSPADAATKALASAGTAANAFDDNDATNWQSGTGMPQWVGWDFTSSVELAEARFKQVSSDAHHLTHVRVEYSDDATTWNFAWIWTGYAIDGTLITSRPTDAPLLDEPSRVQIRGVSAYERTISTVLNSGGVTSEPTVAGDLVLAYIMHRSAITEVPDGWELIAYQATSSPTMPLQAISVYQHRILTDGEFTSETWRQASSGRFIGFMVEYYNPDGGEVTASAITSGSAENVSAVSMSAPPITPDHTGSRVAVVGSIIAIGTPAFWWYSGGAIENRLTLEDSDARLMPGHTPDDLSVIAGEALTVGGGTTDTASSGNGLAMIAIELAAGNTPITVDFDTTWNVAAAYEPITVSFAMAWNVYDVYVRKQLQFFWAIEEQPYEPGGGASALHWRVNVNETQGSDGAAFYYTYMNEIVLETTTGSGQLAVGGIVTSADTQDGAPEDAFDGDIDTFWEGDSNDLDGGQWIAYEFTEPVTVGSLTITCGDIGYPDERPIAGTMDYSDDGVTWTMGWPWSLPFTNTTETETFTDTGSTGQPLTVSFNTTWMLGLDSEPFVTKDFVAAWNVYEPPVDTSRFVIPDYPVTELWTFQTSIFRSRDGTEERRARVLRPVISIQYAAPSFDPADFQVTRRTLEIDTEDFYPVPLYQYYAYLDADAHIGDTRVYFNQQRTNVVPGQYVAFIGEDAEPIVLRVDEIHDDGVTLVFPLTIELGRNYMACPVIFSRLGADASTQHSPVHAYTTFSFVSAERELDFIRPGNNVTLPMLGDIPLLARYIRANDEVAETMLSGNTTIDNARANPVMFVKEGTRKQLAVAYKVDRLTDPAGMDFWRQFFGHIRGAQKAFALPTFRPDAEPMFAIDSGDTEITLSGPDFYEVWQRGGYAGVALGFEAQLALEPCAVVDVTLVAGNSVCQLAAPIVGSGYDTVTFIMSVRCASDQITLSHTDVETLITFSVVSVRT